MIQTLIALCVLLRLVEGQAHVTQILQRVQFSKLCIQSHSTRVVPKLAINIQRNIINSCYIVTIETR